MRGTGRGGNGDNGGKIVSSNKKGETNVPHGPSSRAWSPIPASQFLHCPRLDES